MATLTLKGIPDELLARLKREAAENRRSLNREVIHRLAQSAESSKRDTAALLREIDARRSRIKVRPISTAQLKRWIEEGRE